MQVEVARRVAPARRGHRRTHLRTGILFMSPAFLVMLVFLIGPVLYALYVSGTNMALTGVGAAAPQWVGLTN
ncbi:MAG TPA: sugar ABC transporter permease, partial [Chloroflexota bacterium]|nr:sugar ABC transporter permease [Chloroflexota bacterium]